MLVWSAVGSPAGGTEPATIIAECDTAPATGPALTLGVGPCGATATVTWPGGTADLVTGTALRPGVWHRLWLAIDPARGKIRLGQRAPEGAGVTIEADAPGLAFMSGGTVMFAADTPAEPRHHFTGKIEAPTLLPGCVDPNDPADLLPTPIATWDFAVGIDTQTITDTGPLACHGDLVNLPRRAVVGAGWSGREHCWRHAPDDYAAIHFHADDLADCGWSIDFTWTVPDGLASGAYAIHLSCADGCDVLPLYVLPCRVGPFAKIVFLAATFTYQAYANHARGNADAAWHARAASWGAAPHNPDQWPLYGRSTYNRHPDGAGISFSSRLRPMLTMRPGFLTFDDPRGSGLRHYPADTHLLAWLGAKGLDFDIVTDEDLDDEGVAILAPYRAVLTSTHPEYHTPGTLDALGAYLDGGGNLACLGGNGFYWRVARSKALPHVLELRRAEGGVRAWAAEPGEYYHQLDGALGGLWRRARRAPQRLTGVGFCGQGRFESGFFRRTEASHDATFAWMFEGVDGDVLGDYGLSGGGAAGFELDRTDATLGTPHGTVVLARAESLPKSFFTVFEEMLSTQLTLTGEPPDAVMRGEIA